MILLIIINYRITIKDRLKHHLSTACREKHSVPSILWGKDA